mmetsp:Transcript_13359/g.26160  ORF Transcript_13359/g.26160 Transcript_13359/m.26160 type:complete len:84 (+) Transcript_13359:429-680(+)
MNFRLTPFSAEINHLEVDLTPSVLGIESRKMLFDDAYICRFGRKTPSPGQSVYMRVHRKTRRDVVSLREDNRSSLRADTRKAL